VDHTYEQFLNHVATGRGKTRDAVDDIAQGRVWAGVDALPIGLIDRLGGYQDAVKAAAKRAGLQGRLWRAAYRAGAELAAAAAAAGANRRRARAERASVGLHAGIGALAQRLAPLDRELARWARLTAPHTLYAYCFCSVD
jgi:protease-4